MLCEAWYTTWGDVWAVKNGKKWEEAHRMQ
jgi:hypothetical protein